MIANRRERLVVETYLRFALPTFRPTYVPTIPTYPKLALLGKIVLMGEKQRGGADGRERGKSGRERQADGQRSSLYSIIAGGCLNV